jgi:hypothetical protein
VIDEILEERVVSSRGRRNPRAIKRKVGKWPIRHHVRAGQPNTREKLLYEVEVIM